MKNFKVVILLIIDFVLDGFIGSYVWNNTIANIFNITTITFWQAIAIGMFSLFFIKQTEYKERNINDNINILINDIVYTIVIFIFTFIIVNFNFI